MANVQYSLEFPRNPFPVYHKHPDAETMGQKHSSSQAKSDDQEFQEFNAVEYGKQTAIVLLEDARFLCAAEGIGSACARIRNAFTYLT